MILRPTTQSTNNTMLNYIFTNQNKYNELSEQSSSGKKLMTPSDNPIDASSVLNVNKQMSQLEGYLNNMATAQNELNVLDNSLSSITSALQKANDLAVQGASETCGDTARASLKQQVDQIIQNLIDVGNTNYNGTYIFAGTNTSTAPFQEIATGGVGYTGTANTDAYQRYIQISDGVKTAINAPGDTVLGSYDVNTSTGTGVFKTLYELSAALGSGDTAGIRDSLDQLQGEIDNTSNIRTTYASITARFKMTQNSIETSQLQLTEYKSSLEDIDISEALTNLANQNIALQATMKVASMTINSSSLLNYL